MEKYFLSTEFKEIKPEDYKLNRLLVVEGKKVKVCDALNHTVSVIELTEETQNVINRLYKQIDMIEFVSRYFNHKSP